jgi:putative Ca2+/H+ antiporter (TMEM165/GDT1 family)
MLLAFSLAAFSAAFLLVTIAEMGDKTQFLAISFAARHNVYKVILGVFLAIIADFAITVAIGQLLTTVVPLDIISLAASISFIGFGLWTLRGEKHKVEKEKASRFGTVSTVAIAFFIAEFGDKTQLATISLVAQYQNALSVFLGAILGMLLADGIGIVIGVVFCKRIPEKIFKWASALIFLVFGLVGIYEVLPAKIGLTYTALLLLALVIISAAALVALAKKQARQNPKSTDSTEPPLCQPPKKTRLNES